MINLVKKLWDGDSGYKKLLLTALPLILSTASWSILQFTDRMFLTWYSPEAIAATMPAGILNFTVMSLFIGTASYIGTFIAQYYGAGDLKKIGKTLWQGVYISLLGVIILFILGLFSTQIFDFIGHSKEVRVYENIYFSILCFGAAGPIVSSVLSGFFSGLARNFPIMFANFAATLVNIVLDYALIFGKFGFPKMGVEGAAIATVVSGLMPLIIYAVMIYSRKNRALYDTAGGFRFDLKLVVRILKFGLPSGIHFFIDVFGFTMFLLLVGKLGTNELAATNIAFNINTIAFMPMIGFGIAISMLVGQNIGRGDIKMAEKTIWSGFQLCFVYITFMALMYFFLPDMFIYPFVRGADPVKFKPIYAFTLILLKFVAIYSVFDTMNIIFASAIKGAGDTMFVMFMGGFLSICVLVIPTYIFVVVLGMGLYAAWFIASAYIILMGFAFFLRFLTGKWKSKKVIETAPLVPSSYPDIPSNDL